MQRPRGARTAGVYVIAVLAGWLTTAAQAAPGDQVGFPFPISPPEHTQRNADVARSGNGNFAVVWNHWSAVQVRLFDANGTPRGAEQNVVRRPPSTTGDAFYRTGIAMARDGRFVVAWYASSVFPTPGLYARLYDANGSPRGDSFRVDDAATANVSEFSIDMASSTGHFAVAWQGRDGTATSPFVRMFDADGAALTGPLRTTAPPGVHTLGTSARVALDAIGNAVVVWLEAAPGLIGKRFTATGALIGTEFIAAAENDLGDVFAFFDVAMGDSGEFVVVYRRIAQVGSVSSGPYARRFAANGAAHGAEFRVSQGDGTAGDIGAAMDPSNNWVVGWWQRDRLAGIEVPRFHARLYEGISTPVTNDEALEFPYFGTLPSLRIAMDDQSNFVALWRRQDGSPVPRIWGQRFAGAQDTRPSCRKYVATRVGTGRSDTITGGSGTDVIVGWAGNDRIDGGGGDDVICGGAGDDVLFGSAGNDAISGGSGDDVMDGGDGTDRCNGDTHTNGDSAVQCEAVGNVP